MKRGFLTIATLTSVIFLPWPFTLVLALASALYLPLLPLAAGIFSDVLYWGPAAGGLPLATLLGALVSVVAIIVRSRLTTGIIGE
jgi:hypothetical protein